MTSSLMYQVRRVSSSFWTLRGKLTSRRPHTAMYKDGPARRVSVSVFAKPTSSMKRSAPIALSMRRLFVAPPHAVAMEFNLFRERRSRHWVKGGGVSKRELLVG